MVGGLRPAMQIDGMASTVQRTFYLLRELAPPSKLMAWIALMANLHITKDEEWAFTVRRPDPSAVNVEVNVYEIMGFEGLPDEPDTQVPLFELSDGPNWTTTLASARPLISGYIKWDHCSDWNFDTGIHFCGYKAAASLGPLFQQVYEEASVILKDCWLTNSFELDNPNG